MIFNEGKYSANWSIKKLMDLGYYSRGVSKHRPRNDKKLSEGGGYPLVQTGDIKGANLYIIKHTQEYNDFGLKQSKLWPKGTLCITIAANIAETAILSYPMCFPDSVVGFIADKNQTTEEFMYYIFDYIRQSIQKTATGSAQDNINMEYLESLKFRTPPLEYQNKITDMLLSIDNKILLNNKINNNLYEQMSLIFEDMMFKANSNQINGHFVSMNELVDVVTGKEDANFSATNGKYKFFTCSNKPLLCKKYHFDSSSILIAGNGDFNVKHFSGKFNAYQRTYVLTPHKSYYALLYLTSLYAINSFKTKSSGSIVKFITKGDIENIKVFIPNDSTYLNILNQLINLQEIYSKESDKLIQFRNFLLPMLMNGQVTIGD